MQSAPAGSIGLPMQAPAPTKHRLRRLGVVTALAALAALAWAALAPIVPDSHDELFEIPHGTYARRMAGDKVEILPSTIRLRLGLNDVLLLRNLDEVPQVFGPALIMPGQSLRLPFEVASTYSFACSAHASGQLDVIVDPAIARGWSTLVWRARHWLGKAAAAAQPARR